ncbi:TSUP family transporter [Paenibacillus sp. WST5]|uniref:Probable membrane transporter protein n=2 Tax=Paenibacillus sedimenti TaxID=2770274 RepID=A0A926QHM5_9BACL|nr:TSUP family transporter [Paenibacillus sedimenti]
MSYEITLIGLAVGLLVGLIGVGGAALLMPISVLICIKPSIAVGTDLVYNSIIKLFGTVQHVRQKTVEYKLMKYLAMGSIPGAIAATILLQTYESMYRDQEKLIKQSLGFVLLLVAISMILVSFLRKGENRKEVEIHELPFRMPVQAVYKFTQDQDDRRIVAGTIDAGDEIIFYPSGKKHCKKY